MWTELVNVGRGILDVYNTLKGVIKNAYGVLRSYVVPVWNTITGPIKAVWQWADKNLGFVWAGLEKAYNVIDSIFTTLNKAIDTVYNTLFGKIITAYDRIREVGEKAARLIGIVNKDLSRKIIDGLDGLRADTIGRFEHLRGAIVMELDTLRYGILGRIDDLRIAVHDLVDPFIAKADATVEFLGKAFEDSVTLQDDTVKHTTRKHGMTMWDGLLGHAGSPATPADREAMVRMKTHGEIDFNLDNLELADKGPWADVDNNINIALDALDKGEELPDLTLDRTLMLPDEEDVYDKAMEELEAWEKEE